MDRNEILLTGALIVVVIVGGLLNANRVHDSTFTPVVVEERSKEPNDRDSSTGNSGPVGLSAGDSEPAVSGKKDINTATLEQLMIVKGIGESLAQEIIKYREMKGLYRSMSDLDNVSGIGKKRLELLSEYFEVRIPPLPDQDRSITPNPAPASVIDTNTAFSTGQLEAGKDLQQGWTVQSDPGQMQQPVGLININVASEEELDRLPGIGKVLARRIVEDRYMYGAYFQKTDIMRVDGIGEKTYLKIEPWIETGY